MAECAVIPVARYLRTAKLKAAAEWMRYAFLIVRRAVAIMVLIGVALKLLKWI